MNLNRLDSLAVGLVLVLAISFLDLTTALGGLLYLILAVYLLRFSGSINNVFILGIATTLSIIVGYFVSGEGATQYTTIINRVISVSAVWMGIYANLKIRKILAEKTQANELIKSLTAQKDLALSQLQAASGDLVLQVDKRKAIELELLKRKKLQDDLSS